MGSRLVRLLVNEGHSVICTKQQHSNLSRLRDLEKQIIWIPSSADAVEAILKICNIDFVVNTVCNYGRGAASYQEIVHANMEFPLGVFQTAIKNGVCRFLTIDTSLPDDFNMYSFSKYMLAQYGRFFTCKNNVDFYNIRLEMFYGADEPEDRFLPSVIRKMLTGKDVDTTIGTQKRDVIAADDVVAAISMILKSDIHGYHDIPVGTGVAPSISEIIDFIWNETGKKSRVNKNAVPMRKDEPDCVAETTVLEMFGTWKPVDWQSGLRSMISQIKLDLGDSEGL